jgi:hypothetical protein
MGEQLVECVAIACTGIDEQLGGIDGFWSGHQQGRSGRPGRAPGESHNTGAGCAVKARERRTSIE